MNGHDEPARARSDYDEEPDHDVEEFVNAHAAIVIHCKTACKRSSKCDERILVHMCSEAEEKKERIPDECR